MAGRRQRRSGDEGEIVAVRPAEHAVPGQLIEQAIDLTGEDGLRTGGHHGQAGEGRARTCSRFRGTSISTT